MKLASPCVVYNVKNVRLRGRKKVSWGYPHTLLFNDVYSWAKSDQGQNPRPSDCWMMILPYPFQGVEE